jgi:hypothetical protein
VVKVEVAAIVGVEVGILRIGRGVAPEPHH